MLQNAAVESLQLGEVELSPWPLPIAAAQFDLTLSLTETEQGLTGGIVYSTDLFDAETVERLAEHFTRLLRSLVERPEQRLSELRLLSAGERRQLLVEWGHAVSYEPERCLHQLFEAQVERSPEAVAVVYEDEQLSYRELNERANRLAHHLLASGVGPEVLVGLCVERSAELVVALLAILKAGGAYVPLDPAYPRERLAYMIADAGMAVIVTHSALRHLLGAFEGVLVAVDETEAATAGRAANPVAAVWPQSAAYLIYTSGSTGRPKGTVVTHHNVVRLFAATAREFDFSAADVWTMFHSYAFDFSVWEMWGALLYGGRLVVVPYLVSRSPGSFYELLCAQGVTVLNQTPSAFRQLAPVLGAEAERGLRVRWVIFGGEALEVSV
ncbi:MAG TPA: AMP-binding protein, partial [Myxococcota bacterium]|nr:AMP-binding protein [Myxococcota bacterium]